MNNNQIPEPTEPNQPNPPQKVEPERAPEVEPIETDKGEKDLPAEAYPISDSFSTFFKPQSAYEKYINEPEDKWE